MAHYEQQEFCRRISAKYPKYFTGKKVLDIGSLDINGNNRFFIDSCNYIGLDVGDGPNVDVVQVAHLYDAPDEVFDLIISTEVFEHDMFYEKSIQNIIRMLKPGGYFIMEHYEKQGELVRDALSAQFSNAQTHADLNGRDRFTSARKR